MTFRDTSARNKAEFARREASERWRLASETAELGVWDANLVTGEMYWSPKFLSIVGLEPNSPARAERFASLLEAEDRLDFEELFQSVVTGETRSRMRAVYRIVRPRDGEPRWVLMLGLVLLDNSRKPSRMIGTIQDVTEMRSAEEQARYAAFHDVLTGLPNRGLFLDQLGAFLGQTDGDDGVGVFLLDIAGFKEINETLGHDAGDDVLAAVGERLAASLSDRGAASRLGADEFAIALPGLKGESDVMATALDLLRKLREPIKIGELSVEPAAHVGMAFSLHDGREPAQLIKNAEIALHVAKASDERAPLHFNASMRQPIIARVHQELQARQALTDDRILPFYQPKIDLKTGACVGFEALLRWLDPKRGLQTPDSIFAAFSHPALACEIGRRMLDCVLTDLRKWNDSGVAIDHVSLNLSEIELRRSDFVDTFLARLEALDIPVAQVQVEVTEPALLGKDAYAVTLALKVLQSVGVKVAMDDFGVGFTSLTLLREHPIDIIKIDRSFTRELGRNQDALAVARAAIKLGQDLRKKIVAVGLATPEQRDLVAACGCDMGQGFLLGRPMTAAQVPSFGLDGEIQGQGGVR